MRAKLRVSIDAVAEVVSIAEKIKIFIKYGIDKINKMDEMLNHIKNLIKNGYYDIKLHTRKRMIERDIKINDVKEAIQNG